MDLMRIYQEMLLLWRLLTKSIVGYFSSTEKIDIYCRIWKGWLCNAIIQPHFHYACSAWYPNLNKKFKSKLKTIQNKCIRFCLQLNIRSHIGIKESEQINWLPVYERFNQCICSNTFKFFNDNCPLYLYDLSKPSGQDQINTSPHRNCIHFVYSLYTKVCQNIRYILQNICQNVRYILYIFCIYQFWFKAHIINVIYKFYTKLIQNVYIQIIVYRMDPLFQHVLTHLFCTS